MTQRRCEPALRTSDEIFKAVVAQGRLRRRRWGAAAALSLMLAIAVPTLELVDDKDPQVVADRLPEPSTTRLDTDPVDAEQAEAETACRGASDGIRPSHETKAVIRMTVAGVVREWVPPDALAAWQSMDPNSPTVMCVFELHECPILRA